LFAYIVDDNIASQTLFETTMGWERISTADWMTVLCKIDVLP